MPASAAGSAPVPFPQGLDQVPVEDQIATSLGYLPAGFGLLALLSATAILIFPSQFPWRLSPAGLAILLGLILIAGGMFYWELRRRSRSARVLVPRGGLVGIYSGGQFSETVQRNQINFYQYHHGNTLYRGVGGLGLLIACWVRASEAGVFTIQDAFQFAAMSAGALFLLLTLYNRIRLLQYFIPTKGGISEAGVELTRSAAKKLFSAPASVPAPRLANAIGIVTASGLSEMIPAGSTLPDTRSETFGNADDNQDAIRITIAQNVASGIEQVLVADINQLPPRPKGRLNVTVTLTVDAQKQLRLKATVSETAYVKQFGPVPVN